jgi:S1-C subfamily serine protease
MSKPTPPDLVESSPLQYWIARLVPMLYITTLTLWLPTILSQIFGMSEVSAIQEQKLRQHLRSISIEILADGETLGGGVLIAKQQRVYTVITHAHVIQSASAPFQLQTPDGQIYAAALVTPPIGQNRDLSLLRFQSLDRTYITAKLATASPKSGDRVWSAGFPLKGTNQTVEGTPSPTLPPNIVSGQIVQILPMPIAGGYSIGSDLPIEHGTSGGALIDRSGRLVGINGVQVKSLWNNPEVLEDGSKVGDVLHHQIRNSHWAIPSNFIKEFARL